MKTKSIAIVCFAADLFLSIWSYFKFSNYDEYVKLTKGIIDSPDFQVQVYQVLLQTLIFSLLLFLFFHFIIYLLLWRENKFAAKYVRVYTLMAAISCVIMIFSSLWWAAIALIAYGWGFKEIRQYLKQKALAEKQIPPQSSI